MHKTILFCTLLTRNNFTLLAEIWFCIFDPLELSRSMAAILEMPQYVAYLKNVAYAFFLHTLPNLILLTDGAHYCHAKSIYRLILIGNINLPAAHSSGGATRISIFNSHAALSISHLLS